MLSSRTTNFHHPPPPPPPHMGFHNYLAAQYPLPPFVQYNYAYHLPPLFPVNFSTHNDNPGFVYYPQDETLMLSTANDPSLPNNLPTSNNNHRSSRSTNINHDDSVRGPRNRNPNHQRRRYLNFIVPTNYASAPPIVHHDNQQHNLVIGSTSLSEETIVKNLRRKRIGPDAADYDGEKICVVCQDGLFEEENDEIATLHCGHDYHPECIKNWLFQKNVCPICKSTGIPCVD